MRYSCRANAAIYQAAAAAQTPPSETAVIIAHQNIHFLGQGLDLVQRIGDLYAKPGPHGQASTGAHMRHVLDCYRCFLRGLEPVQVPTAAAPVNYDDRERDPKVETDGAYASNVIRQLIAALERLKPSDLDRSLRVQVDAAAWNQDDAIWSSSSVGRELQFLLSHTVHHYAIMSLILRAEGFDPGAEFGVAPSTLEYRRTATPVGA